MTEQHERTHEKDLEVGKEYFLDAMRKDSGFFFSARERAICFLPSKGTGYHLSDGGLICFPANNRGYREVNKK